MESKCLLCGAQPRRSVHLQNDKFAPFHHLAICNFPPSDPQLSDIRTTILPDVERDIAAMNTTIDAARAALQSLEQQRDVLNDVRQRYRNIISTQRRIPQEIWSEIFLYAHSLDSDRSSCYDWPFRTIWKLGQVCQTWRNLAFSLHSCWSSLQLNFQPHRPPSEQDVELLAFVLECSRGHLLDIYIDNAGIDDLPFLHMREKVVAESMRWRKAHLIDWGFAPDLLYAPLRGRLLQLEVLDVETFKDNHSHTGLSAFGDCPRLVNVGITGADPRAIELPVQQLTSLRLFQSWGADRFEASIELVSQCPLLETLHVAFDEVSLPFPQSVTLDFLRELRVGDPNVLNSLTLPRLEVVDLSQTDLNSHPDALYSFFSLIRRSNCASNLTELRMWRVPLTLHPSEPRLLHSILSQTTALTTLQLNVRLQVPWRSPQDDCSVTQVVDFMKALELVPGHRTTFLPQLVSLDIHLTGHTNLDCIPYLEPHDDFVHMLRARHAGNDGGVSHLDLFHFPVYFDVDRPRLEMEAVLDDYNTSVLRGLQGDGMDLRIEFSGSLTFKL